MTLKKVLTKADVGDSKAAFAQVAVPETWREGRLSADEGSAAATAEGAEGAGRRTQRQRLEGFGVAPGGGLLQRRRRMLGARLKVVHAVEAGDRRATAKQHTDTTHQIKIIKKLLRGEK